MNLDKDTNPKQIFGDMKVDLSCVPDTLPMYASMTFTEGALKYGRYNWRIAGVRVSTYISAARRHLSLFWNGEMADADTHVPHLASALACIGIIVDSIIQGNIQDDRPPHQPMYGVELVALQGLKAHLKQLLADKNPKQYSIVDSGGNWISSNEKSTGEKS